MEPFRSEGRVARSFDPARVTGLRSRLAPADPRFVRLAACARSAKLRGLHRAFRTPEGEPVRLLIDRPHVTVDEVTRIKLHFATGTVTLALGTMQWPAVASAACIDDRDERNALCGLLLAAAIPVLAAFEWRVDVMTAAESGSASASASTSVASGVALAHDGRRIDLVDADDRFLDGMNFRSPTDPSFAPNCRGAFRFVAAR